MAFSFDQKILEFLVCPVSKGPLTYDPQGPRLISEKARLAYPIKDGIPVLIPDEAIPLEPDYA